MKLDQKDNETTKCMTLLCVKYFQTFPFIIKNFVIIVLKFLLYINDFYYSCINL